MRGGEGAGGGGRKEAKVREIVDTICSRNKKTTIAAAVAARTEASIAQTKKVSIAATT